LESFVSCSNRLTTFLLPWLCIVADVKKKKNCHLTAEVLLAAEKSVFSQKKSQEDTKKDTACPELLQQAACL